MSNERQGLFEFDNFRLEAAERRLTRDGEPVPLAPRVFDLLCLLVENHGHLVEKDLLLKKLWPDSFVEEANLSVNVSALRKSLGDGGKYIETVPKRGYRFIGEIRETVVEPVVLPPVVVTPVSSPPAQGRKRSLLWLVPIILLAALGGFRWWRTGSGRSEIRSLAVLPFLPLTGDDSQQYLGQGIADSVGTRLSAARRLEVRPTSSLAKFTGPTRDVLAAGRELNVDAVLDGRVQLAEKRIRVTVQLLRVSDGKTLWADTINDYFTNIFAVQDTIADRVASAVSLQFTADEERRQNRRSTENTEAYRLYLQGQYLVNKRLNEATVGALDYFQRAVSLDPEYAQPYAAMAGSYLFRAGEGWNEGLRDKAKTAALKALSLDDQLPEAHIALGQVLMRADWDWKGAERAFRKALALDDRLAGAHAAIGTLWTAEGRHADSVREAEAAVRLEPGSASLRSDLSWALLFARRHEEAVREGLKAVELDAWSYTAHRQLAKAYLMSSKYDEAVAAARRSLEINGGRRRRTLTELATALAVAGRIDEAHGILAELLHEKWTEPEPAYEMALLYAALHDKDAALEFLKAACDRRLTRCIWMGVDPEFASLGSDARFQAIVARLGLPH